MADSTPRIDGSLLEQYKNRTVRVIGKVEQIDGSNLKLYTPSDNSNNLSITVSTTPDLEFQQGIWYEIIGRVLDNLTLRAIDIQNFGENINEKAVAGLVKYSNKSSEIFYE
ncbi:Replication protein A 14 kDa subunit [Wickerhamomyces ciferrii]|uniref:Replication protein A 14 kDa subunit n=1 Tax=Wickerhamomyces ciferrii (strain ATCC 14091 / BCRC 22168 / CBS 111 / JCM 3599 / NBRC 0793 / NRRL Y-1031 F-60-10) TaxID=1206466 RepID=K0KNT3_WICCF|nr:Replication protein A 14 kDa subunit [Wickerhamomyces ciferrii]CCH46935.1 Replication protein A 14 kDa subunit [Wickerhamomyces ciferrii]